MIYKLLMPYLSLVEPHFDNVMGRARDVTRDSVSQVRNRAIQYVNERKDDVVGIVRRCAVLALVGRRQVYAIAPTVASPVSGSFCVRISRPVFAGDANDNHRHANASGRCPACWRS